MENKPAIIMSGNKNNMQPWYEEKSKRALEELAHLADTLRRPGDEPKGGWQTKTEEIEHHLFYAVKSILVMAALTTGHPGVSKEDIECILNEGYTGYKKVTEKFSQ